jgi:hypothetical protein
MIDDNLSARNIFTLTLTLNFTFFDQSKCILNFFLQHFVSGLAEFQDYCCGLAIGGVPHFENQRISVQQIQQKISGLAISGHEKN